MLSEAKSRLSGDVDRGIVAVEERGGGHDVDLVLGNVRRGLHEGGHGYGCRLVPRSGAKLPEGGENGEGVEKGEKANGERSVVSGGPP